MITFKEDELITICAFRYALGRRSYMVGIVADEIVNNWKQLSPNTRKLIKDEIIDYKNNYLIGDSCDANEWERVLKLDDMRPAVEYSIHHKGAKLSGFDTPG